MVQYSPIKGPKGPKPTRQAQSPAPHCMFPAILVPGVQFPVQVELSEFGGNSVEVLASAGISGCVPLPPETCSCMLPALLGGVLGAGAEADPAELPLAGPSRGLRDAPTSLGRLGRWGPRLEAGTTSFAGWGVRHSVLSAGASRTQRHTTTHLRHPPLLPIVGVRS